jgi:hypothetical protein
MHSSCTTYLEQPLLEQYLYHLLQDGQQTRVVHPDAPPQHGQRAANLGQAAVFLWERDTGRGRDGRRREVCECECEGREGGEEHGRTECDFGLDFELEFEQVE